MKHLPCPNVHTVVCPENVLSCNKSLTSKSSTNNALSSQAMCCRLGNMAVRSLSWLALTVWNSVRSTAIYDVHEVLKDFPFSYLHSLCYFCDYRLHKYTTFKAHSTIANEEQKVKIQDTRRFIIRWLFTLGTLLVSGTFLEHLSNLVQCSSCHHQWWYGWRWDTTFESITLTLPFTLNSQICHLSPKTQFYQYTTILLQSIYFSSFHRNILPRRL